MLAITSAYYCGKRTVSISRGNHSYYAINTRLLLTACLALLPIVKAYIILTNTTYPMQVNQVLSSDKNNLDNIYNPESTVRANPTIGEPEFVKDAEEVVESIEEHFNKTAEFVKQIFDHAKATLTWTPVPFQKQPYANYNEPSNIENKATSAKPIDYLVAGTEGLAWVVHFCFIFGLRRGNGSNPRGPVSVRALLFLILGISVLLLRSHVKRSQHDDVLPNLSLGFSISVVTLLILYGVTLIPGNESGDSIRRGTGYGQASCSFTTN